MLDWIKTGNDFADSIFLARLMNDPIMLALIDYLESKDVINRVEFSEFVNEHCRTDVLTREKIAREPD